MRIIMFYHSLLSCWNHGNAHFLRGMVSELLSRGHDVRVFEPEGGWSYGNLCAEQGYGPIRCFQARYNLNSRFYDPETIDLGEALDGADMVLVHEWNDHGLVGKIGCHRASSRSYRLLFHDTHHLCVTAPETMAAYDLRHYDGVLAYGQIIREIYISRCWARTAWTWHEAADTRVFKPFFGAEAERSYGDLVWIGNWGDEERTAELMEFFIVPARDLRLRACAYGVRYPDYSIAALSDAGVKYGGWLPNYEAPGVFARFKTTVHIPRGPYVRALPGIPTIRPFEALACAIPLICSPWEDVEGLFTPGKDYLVAKNGQEMKQHLKSLLNDPELSYELSSHGLKTILGRHTCSHRADELLSIYRELEGTAGKSDIKENTSDASRA